MSRFALDCEMVGSYNKSMLARVSIVDERGVVVIDEIVKPISPVTDCRENWSGIKKLDLENGVDYYTVKNQVYHILQGNILIGHSLHFDLAALGLYHPEEDCRDLAKYEPLLKDGQPVALKTLAKNLLNRVIQDRGHDSVEDARASMAIYLLLADEWEKNYNQSSNSCTIL